MISSLEIFEVILHKTCDFREMKLFLEKWRIQRMGGLSAGFIKSMPEVRKVFLTYNTSAILFPTARMDHTN